MIRLGDGSDLSNRLDGDAGPATSGDEVLVSAMLSPVYTYKTHNVKTLMAVFYDYIVLGIYYYNCTIVSY